MNACPHCKTKFEFNDLSYRNDEGIAVCDSCGKDFSVVAVMMNQKHYPNKNIDENPKGIRLYHGTERFIMKISAYEVKSGKVNIVTGFILVLVTSFIIPFSLGGFPFENIFASLIFSFFMILGWYLSMIGIAAWINQTTIEVNKRKVKIRHYPIPFPGKTIEVSEIKQLFVRQHLHNNGDRGSTSSYSLNVLLKNGNEKKLISNWTSPLHTVFIESKIEKYLKIEDKKVEGELDSPLYMDLSTSGIIGIFKGMGKQIRDYKKNNEGKNF